MRDQYNYTNYIDMKTFLPSVTQCGLNLEQKSLKTGKNTNIEAI